MVLAKERRLVAISARQILCRPQRDFVELGRSGCAWRGRIRLQPVAAVRRPGHHEGGCAIGRGTRGCQIVFPVRLGGAVVAERQAVSADEEWHIERQLATTGKRAPFQPDRASLAVGNELPRSTPTEQPADLFGGTEISELNLAVRTATDPDRNPGQLHDANRARFAILDVQTRGFGHRGIDSSLTHTLCGWVYPRSTNKSVPPDSQRFQVPPRALAEIATAGSSTAQCTTDHRVKPRAAPIKP